MQHLRVRPQMPGMLRMALWVLGVLAVLTIGMFASRWGYQQGVSAGKETAGAAALERLAYERLELVKKLQAEQVDLTQQLKVEAATRDQLLSELRRAQSEIARLRDEAAFFERLLTEPDRARPLAIESFGITPLTEDKYRYRVLLIQGQRGEVEFRGDYSLMLKLASGESIAWPEDGRKLPITVKQYARIESDLRVPARAELRKVEVRIYAAGGAKPQLVRTFDVKG